MRHGWIYHAIALCKTQTSLNLHWVLIPASWRPIRSSPLYLLSLKPYWLHSEHTSVQTFTAHFPLVGVFFRFPDSWLRELYSDTNSTWSHLLNLLFTPNPWATFFPSPFVFHLNTDHDQRHHTVHKFIFLLQFLNPARVSKKAIDYVCQVPAPQLHPATE